MLSRRSFIEAGSLAALLTTQGRSAQLSSIGVQLYTVRTVLPKDPLKTLQAIEAIGYKEIETGGVPVDQIWPALEKTKLKPVSAHLDSKLVTQGPEDQLART